MPCMRKGCFNHEKLGITPWQHDQHDDALLTRVMIPVAWFELVGTARTKTTGVQNGNHAWVDTTQYKLLFNRSVHGRAYVQLYILCCTFATAT